MNKCTFLFQQIVSKEERDSSAGEWGSLNTRIQTATCITQLLSHCLLDAVNAFGQTTSGEIIVSVYIKHLMEKMMKQVEKSLTNMSVRTSWRFPKTLSALLKSHNTSVPNVCEVVSERKCIPDQWIQSERFVLAKLSVSNVHGLEFGLVSNDQ